MITLTPMSKEILEDMQQAPIVGAGGAKAKLEKQARQLAYDTKYKVKQALSAKSGGNADPAAVAKMYLAQLAKSPAPPAIKALAKKKLMGEEYVDVKGFVVDSVTDALLKVFVEKKDETVEEVIEEEKGEQKFHIKVTDKKTGSTYHRYATRAKISELRANSNIATVEMSHQGEAGTKAKKDHDGDGKVESPSKEHAGAVHNAIQKAKGGTPDGKDTRKEEVIPEAKYEAGASTYGKMSIRNKRAVGYGGNAAPPEERMKAHDERMKKHKGMKEEVKIDEGHKNPESVKGIAKELDKAVEMHKSQAKRLRKSGVSEEKKALEALGLFTTEEIEEILEKMEYERDMDHPKTTRETKAGDPNQITTREPVKRPSTIKDKKSPKKMYPGKYQDSGGVVLGKKVRVGEALDPVGKEDGDVNNDGKKNSTDKYLMKRRAAIGKAMGKKNIRGNDSAEQKARLEKKRGMKLDDHPQFKKEESDYNYVEAYLGELHKGRHGQSEKDYQDSRSNAGKMISGDSKGSGANYSYKAKNTGSNPAGGSKKPQGQARMSTNDRAYLAYQKANLKKEAFAFSDLELEELNEFAQVIDQMTDEQLVDFMEEIILETAEDQNDLIEICEHLESVELLSEVSDSYYDSATNASKASAKANRPSRMDRMKSAAKAAGSRVKAGVKKVGKKVVQTAGKVAGEFSAAKEKQKAKAMARSDSSSSDSDSDSESTTTTTTTTSAPAKKKRPSLLGRAARAVGRGLKKAVGKTARAVSGGSDKLAKRLGEDYDQIAHLYESGKFTITEIENIIESE